MFFFDTKTIDKTFWLSQIIRFNTSIRIWRLVDFFQFIKKPVSYKRYGFTVVY
jgi:hypothetical protein